MKYLMTYSCDSLSHDKELDGTSELNQAMAEVFSSVASGCQVDSLTIRSL